MTSLCRHLSEPEIVNWVTTADGCVHTDDTTKLLPTSCEFVYTPPTRRDSTVSSRLVGVGGVYWALTTVTTKTITRCLCLTGFKLEMG